MNTSVRHALPLIVAGAMLALLGACRDVPTSTGPNAIRGAWESPSGTCYGWEQATTTCGLTVTTSPSNLARNPYSGLIYNYSTDYDGDFLTSQPALHIIDVTFSAPVTRLDIGWVHSQYNNAGTGCVTPGPLYVVTTAGTQVEVPFPTPGPDADVCSFSLTYRDTSGIVGVLAHPTPDPPAVWDWDLDPPGGVCEEACYDPQYSALSLRWDPPPTPPTPPPVVATATCTPAAPTRGDTINCSVNVPGASYTVLRQRAKAKDFTIDERPNVTLPANQSYVWGGAQAVATSEVEFTVRYTVAGSQKDTTAKTRFDVQTRQWDTLRLTNSPVHHKATDAFMRRFPCCTVGDPGTKIGLFDTVMPVIGRHGGNVVSVSSGPNTGLAFVATQVVMPDSTVVWTHPELYGSTFTPSWYADQNGQGSGTCQQSAMAQLAAEAERHEGVTQNPFSHWGVTNRLLAQSSLQKDVEALYSRDSARVVRRVTDQWRRWHGTTYASQHQAYDTQDYRIIYGNLGCTIDYLPPPGDP